MTVRQLAEASGVNKDTISAVERGLRRPHSMTLAKLAEALGVPVDELEAPPKPEPGYELLGRILANTSVLERYMEQPPDEDTWDRALHEHFATAGEGTAFVIRELEQAQADQRPYDRDLAIGLLRAEQARREIRPRLAEFNDAQYGHRHRDAG